METASKNANRYSSAQLGYRMPAEWESHEATWLAWPHNPEDWPGKFQAIPWLYAEIVRLLAARERVHLLVQNEKEQRRADSVLGAPMRISKTSASTNGRRTASGHATRVRFSCATRKGRWPSPTGDSMHGPSIPTGNLTTRFPIAPQNCSTCLNGSPSIDLAGEQRRLVLEGGSIDTNGQGILLTTEECLLSEVQQRNPGVSREKLERCISRLSWNRTGDLAGDGESPATTPTGTSTISRDSSRPQPSSPLLSQIRTTRTTNPWPKISARLKAARTADGKQFTIVELPLPRPVVFRKQRLPASYANFYIANGLVLVPTFHDPNDRIALGILAELFPDREVIGIHAVDLVWGLGTLHCMTQQQPSSLPQNRP